MCLSPHEMSTAQIEQRIADMRRWAEAGPDDGYWEWRIEEMEKILKERANAGTY